MPDPTPLVPVVAPATDPTPAAAATAPAAAAVAPGTAAPAVDPGAPVTAALPAPTAAPDTYTATVPADATRLVHATDLDYLKEVARHNHWTQQEFQTELDAQIDRARTRRTQTISEWEATTRADVDYGGTHLGDTQRYATLAIDRLRPADHPRRESFIRFLNESGGSVHLEVVAFLADLGRLMGEDRGVLGRTSAPQAPFYNHPTSIAAAEAVRQRVAGGR